MHVVCFFSNFNGRKTMFLEICWPIEQILRIFLFQTYYLNRNKVLCNSLKYFMIEVPHIASNTLFSVWWPGWKHKAVCDWMLNGALHAERFLLHQVRKPCQCIVVNQNSVYFLLFHCFGHRCRGAECYCNESDTLWSEVEILHPAVNLKYINCRK